ncbi:MAG: hypothetical protein LBD41_04670 [Clostridiales Family XIII bacterium]|jgi:hypothetical protein|nr:hypothetical protein [Clostridiales Family XIII bacterium]
MRAIILDELRKEEIERIDNYLKNETTSSNIEGLYWLYLKNSELSENQKKLETQAGPYRISIEIGQNFVRFELLVRAEMITNEGGGEADENQLLYIYRFINKMAHALNLTTCL